MPHLDSIGVKHHWFTVQGLGLHALEFLVPGPASDHADRPPLLLLHGVTGHAWLWLEVATRLAPGQRVIALDLRGHGQSQWSADLQYDSAQHVLDLQGVVQALRLERICLAGLSWGGLIAIAYAARNPSVVSRLAVIDVEASFEEAPEAVPPRPYEFESTASLLDWERKANPRAAESLIARVAIESVRPAVDGYWVRKYDPFFLGCWPFRRDDCWSDLQRLDCPTLMVNAENSFVRPSVMKAMADCAASGLLQTVPNCGHLVPLEAPEALSDLMHRFFEPAPAVAA